MALIRPPWRFNGRRPGRESITARVGEHTRQLAAEVYDSARIDALVTAGVLFSAD